MRFAVTVMIIGLMATHAFCDKNDDRMRRQEMRLTGGTIRKPQSAKGKVVFLNAQKRVASDALQEAISLIDQRIHPIIELVDVKSVDVNDPEPSIRANGGAVGVVIVEDERKPALLVAPEAGWAMVNVTPLLKDAPEDAVGAARVRKEMLRAFALAGGCSFMTRTKVVLDPRVAGVKGLDMIKYEDYGIDTMQTLSAYLPLHGVIPWVETTYEAACQEGWAPQPTNKYQKAIWDKVHELPTKPMKIEFDPAAQKGKVTK